MPLHALAILKSLAVIGAANSAPIVLKRVLGERLAYPIDAGLILPDGHPLFGRSKTWRGLVGAVLLATLAAALVRLPWPAGPLAGAAAMAGDCLSSFIKRRLGFKPSSMALGLDQAPESLLPALACAAYMPLGVLDLAAILLLFFVGELAVSRLLFAGGLRDRPY